MASRRVDEAACSATPDATSPNPALNTTAPPQPRAPACSIASGTPSAGIATITASTGSGSAATDGTHGKPSTSERRGLTPHTGPLNPTLPRFSSASAA